jgi:hypothetical protein
VGVDASDHVIEKVFDFSAFVASERPGLLAGSGLPLENIDSIALAGVDFDQLVHCWVALDASDQGRMAVRHHPRVLASRGVIGHHRLLPQFV